MGRKAFSEEELRYAVKISRTLSHVSKLLGLGGYNTEGGGGGSTNLRTIQNEIRRLRLDTSHFFNPIDPFEFHEPTERMPRSGSRELKYNFLRKHILLPNCPKNVRPYRDLLIEMGILTKGCAGCGRTVHTCYGEELLIRLEIDHVDGNHHNNSPENLRHLCPCCHSLQVTDSGHHKSRRRTRDPESPIALRMRLEQELEVREGEKEENRWLDDGGG